MSERPSRPSAVISTLFFLAIASGISFQCYRSSIPEIDALGYAGLVAFGYTGDVVKAHKMVYGTSLTPHLRGLDSQNALAMDLRSRAADAYAAATHFPDFAIKPLYVLTLRMFHRLGFGVISSTAAVSAVFYLAIAILLWIVTRSWFVLLVMIVPEIRVLGQTNDPDAMSCFFMLFGLWLVFSKRKDIGILPLLLAIWIRPEDLLLCLLAIFALLVQKRLDWLKAAVLAVLSTGSEVAIVHFEYAGQGVFGHVLRAAPGNGALSKYYSSFLQATKDSVHSAVPLFVILCLVSYRLLRPEYRWITALAVSFSAVRFLLFPLYEARYYALFFVTTALAALLVFQEGPFANNVLHEMVFRGLPRPERKLPPMG